MLASVSGLIFALVFFLAVSVAIAVIIYGVLRQASPRPAELGFGTNSKTVAAAIGASCGAVVFLGIYFSSLTGFHSVTLDDDRVQLEAVVPPRSVVLSLQQIATVTSRPAYKARWRLEICMADGQRFESAPAASGTVRDAVLEIERRRLAAPGGEPLEAAASEANCA